MTASALDIATGFLDAWTGGDLRGARAYLADDFAFHGPVARYASADDFIAGSERFVRLLRPGWQRVAAFGDAREALLLYDLELASGDELRVADHHLVADGRLHRESIVWDTYGTPFRPGAGA